MVYLYRRCLLLVAQWFTLCAQRWCNDSILSTVSSFLHLERTKEWLQTFSERGAIYDRKLKISLPTEPRACIWHTQLQLLPVLHQNVCMMPLVQLPSPKNLMRRVWVHYYWATCFLSVVATLEETSLVHYTARFHRPGLQVVSRMANLWP